MDESDVVERRPGSTRVRTRDDLESLAERLISGALAHATPNGAQIRVPGPLGRNGADVDGLEGFARSFLILGFLLAGRDGHDPAGLAERYAAGIEAGTDPVGAERWPRIDEHPQAKVEAASIALVLDLTRPWIWDRLDARVQRQVRDYLAPVVGDDTYPQINWVWFRLVVQTFLRSIGGPWSEGEMRADLATHDRLARPGGWFADGDERAFDHYTGWAFHLYATLWARMEGAEDLAAERGSIDRDRLDRHLADALVLVGADGSPLIQGRSLIYRFAAAAPFWVGAIAGVPSHRPGALRRAALAVISSFTGAGVPAAGDLLTMGWHRAWPRLAQAYSGPGSPYWAAKGLLGLVLDQAQPLWTDDTAPLPVEGRDHLLVAEAPGWIVSATAADGIVRVVNHGTDHARPGDLVGDSPLYARLGYSTATFPLLDDRSWESPLDQTVALVDDWGQATHRAGMTRGVVRIERERGSDGRSLAVASSVADAHWLEPAPVQQHHGSGYVGEAIVAGRVETISLVRGPWEVRCARVVRLTADGRRRARWLRVGGWAVVEGWSASEPGLAWAVGGGRRTVVSCPDPVAEHVVHRVAGADPRADASLVPTARIGCEPGRWVAVVIGLLAGDNDSTPPSVEIVDDRAVVGWADGQTTTPLLEQLAGPPSRDPPPAC